MNSTNTTALAVETFPMIRGKMVEFAACTLFVYDYLLTVGMEVKYVWPGPWTMIKVIYLVQRYIPFVDTFWLESQSRFTHDPSNKTCTQLRTAASCLVFVGLASSELILTFRVWAVWNKHRILTVLLPILFVAFWLPHIPIVYFFLASLKFMGHPPPPLRGCIPAAASEIIFVNWMLLLAWDSLVLILMSIRAFQASSPRGTSLFYIIYAEGIFYYFCIFVMAAINILLLHLRSIDLPYRFMLAIATRLLHSLLASRVLLHIRAAADSTVWQDTDFEQNINAEELEFRHTRWQASSLSEVNNSPCRKHV